ncbi:hypothetical protein [Magnetofaba australis]|uniref:Transmembrane protein n=1 Tax=Magnetofaba australis IT-1 TaxID=1434232 RepID=A0A1Y2KBG3_9PROT|nr:hypothetical protein [Magnetofaba australis]OSM07155.1 hypothetical protein MAIT1_03927 [Magnetofaba australis IT-1]
MAWDAEQRRAFAEAHAQEWKRIYRRVYFFSFWWVFILLGGVATWLGGMFVSWDWRLAWPLATLIWALLFWFTANDLAAKRKRGHIDGETYCPAVVTDVELSDEKHGVWLVKFKYRQLKSGKIKQESDYTTLADVERWPERRLTQDLLIGVFALSNPSEQVVLSDFPAPSGLPALREVGPKGFFDGMWGPIMTSAPPRKRAPKLYGAQRARFRSVYSA